MPASKKFDYAIPPIPCDAYLFYFFKLLAKRRKTFLTRILRDALDLYIKALPLEEREEIEVAITFKT